MKNKNITYLTKLLDHIVYYNTMAPFPVYDTEYVKVLQNKLKEMEKNKKDYDSLPVAACKHCNSLHSLVDELDNVICTRCGSVNEELIYKNIKEYFKATKNNEYN